MMTERLAELSQRIYREWYPSTDLDGVIVDTFTPVTEEFNNKYAKSGHRYNCVTEYEGWNTIANWAVKEGYTIDEGLEINRTLWDDPDVLYRGILRPGASLLVQRVLASGAWLPIITSRDPKLKDSTIATIEKELPNYPIDWLFIRTDKEKNIPGDVFKAEIIKVWKRILHFEDSLAHARLILDTSPQARIVFLSTSTELDHRRRIFRVPAREEAFPDLATFWSIATVQPYLERRKYRRRTMSLTQLFPRYRL